MIASRPRHGLTSIAAPLTVAVVIPTFRRPHDLARLLDSLSGGTRTPDEAIIVNNDPDRTLKLVQSPPFPFQVIDAGLGLNLAGARNLGARAASSDVCVFVDDDNWFDPQALAAMTSEFYDPTVGFVGPVILSADSPRIWCAGVKRSHWTTRTTMLYSGMEEDALPHLSRWMTDEMPDCFAVRAQTLSRVGGFDEQTFPFHYDEADLGERLRHIAIQPYVLRSARIRHYCDTTITDAGTEVVGAFRRHGLGRVYVMVRARVWFHRRHEVGIRRITSLTFGVPAWAVVTAWLILKRERQPKVVAGILGAMGQGLYHGYARKLPGPPDSGTGAPGL